MKDIETERMTLRWFDENDAPFVLALLNDPAWIAGIGERNVRTLEDARRFIAERLVAHYWEKGHGFWAMVRRSDGAVVGMSGLVDRESLPEIDVGYAAIRSSSRRTVDVRTRPSVPASGSDKFR